MADIVLASSLDGKQHLTAWDTLFEARFVAFELEKILIYMVDTVDSKALPYLADSFDLLGFKGWNAATTDQDKRNLIKSAIELKRYLGTDYAIRRALQAVGYYDAEIIKAPDILYNGRFHYDGAINYGGGSWATIAVILDVGESKSIGLPDSDLAVALINEYKNARTKLLYIDYKCTLIDTVTETDELTLSIINQTVDAVNVSDQFFVTTKQADLIDALGTLNDFGITINFVNSSGDIFNTETF